MIRFNVFGLCCFLCLTTAVVAQQEPNEVGKASDEKAGKAGKKVPEVIVDEDPYLWLEDVTGDKALEWVRARNAKTQSKFEADPNFNKLRDDLLAILDSDARIPMVNKSGEYYYNFWRDKKNERGLWRRTTLEEYRKAEPK